MVVYWFFDPIISVGFPIPKIAFLPIIVLWLGFFDVSKITMIVFNTIFPVITATVVGVYGVEKEIDLVGAQPRHGERAMTWEILLPAAMPQIFTGLQVALPIALIVGILTEMAMGGYGIGGSMQTASRMAEFARRVCRHHRDRGGRLCAGQADGGAARIGCWSGIRKRTSRPRCNVTAVFVRKRSCFVRPDTS